MPKLKNRPPKYQRSGKYAVVYHHGKRIYLGDYGSPESQVACSRFVAESQANPTFYLTKGKTDIAVCELTAAFLENAKATTDPNNYAHYRVVVLDFLDKLYGDDTSVDSFKPSCLKLVREAMIQSRRFCRRMVNRYAKRIIAIFAWGVENELVQETTWRALKVVKSLPEGYSGTFDNAEREPVADDVTALNEVKLSTMPLIILASIDVALRHNFERGMNVLFSPPLTSRQKSAILGACRWQISGKHCYKNLIRCLQPIIPMCLIS